MASRKTLLYLGVCLSAWIITTADVVPKAQNVRWVSLDFKTILYWTTKASDYTYTVVYSSDNGDWMDSEDCIQVSGSECDLTNKLEASDRTYTADVKTEPEIVDYNDEPEEYPHTFSPFFNPYKESNISAANFTVEAVDESRVIVNITDPLTGIHRRGKQLSLRDVFKKNLNYKISYYKSGSTNKRDIIAESSTAEVPKLDAGLSYCFMVAAFITTRPKNTQQGAWSKQLCTPGDTNGLQEMSLGAWVGAVFILLTVLIIIVTVTVLCCRCCRQKNTSQSSGSI